jgi:hypothetical protein
MIVLGVVLLSTSMLNTLSPSSQADISRPVAPPRADDAGDAAGDSANVADATGEDMLDGAAPAPPPIMAAALFCSDEKAAKRS